MAEIHSRVMVVRAIEEIDEDNVRVTLRELSAPGAGPAMSGMGSFQFPIARADAPNVLDEITVTAANAA